MLGVRLTTISDHPESGGSHETTRREIIRALVKRVEIDKEQVRVVFRVNPPPSTPQAPSEKDSQSLQHCRGRDYSALRYSAQRSVKRPIFHVSCIEQFSYEVDKPSVMNPFAEYVQEEFMVQFIKTLRDISLYKPCRSSPELIDFS